MGLEERTSVVLGPIFHGALPSGETGCHIHCHMAHLLCRRGSRLLTSWAEWVGPSSAALAGVAVIGFHAGLSWNVSFRGRDGLIQLYVSLVSPVRFWLNK